MTPEDLIKMFPKTMRKLCDNPDAMKRMEDDTAAIMPLRKEVIMSDNSFAPKVQVITRVATHLFERLDRV